MYRGLNQLISSGTITSRWETQEEKQKDPERKGQLRGRPRKIFTLANPLDPDLNEYKEAWKALKKFGKAYQELAKF